MFIKFVFVYNCFSQVGSVQIGLVGRIIFDSHGTECVKTFITYIKFLDLLNLFSIFFSKFFNVKFEKD